MLASVPAKPRGGRIRPLLALAAVLGLAACGGGDGTEAVLNVGSQKGGTKAVMLASGVLEGAPYTVVWSEFPAAQTLLEAIGSGAVDVGLAGDAPFQFAYQSGSPVRAIGTQTAPGRPSAALAIVVPKGSAARSFADLRGKTIATTRGSVGHYLVLQALDAGGFPPSVVRVTFLAPGDAKAAFSSGSIDAWATWVPYLSAALKEGARIVFDAQPLPPAYGFEIANERAIAGKRAELADFLVREARALQWSRTHQRDYAAVLARETGLPPDVALDMVVKNERQRVPLDDKVVAAQRIVAARFERAGVLKVTRNVDEAFDRSFK